MPKLDLVALQLHIVQPRPWLTVRSPRFWHGIFPEITWLICCKHLHKGKCKHLNVWKKLSSQICITSVTWKNIVDSFVAETPCWSSAYHGNHFPGIWLGSTLKNASKNCFTLTLGWFFWGRVFWSIEPSRALFDVDASEWYIFSSRRLCQGIARNLPETRNR